MIRARTTSPFVVLALAAAARTQAKPPEKGAATPAVQAALERASKDLQSGWDCFPTERFAVLYQFDDRKQGAKAKALAEAKQKAAGAALVLARFERDFPPYDAMSDQVSVLRLFADEATRASYVGGHHGHVDWAAAMRLAGEGDVVDAVPQYLWRHYLQRWFAQGAEPEDWFWKVTDGIYSRVQAEGKTLRFREPEHRHGRKLVAATTLAAFLDYRPGDEKFAPPWVSYTANAFADLLERGPKKLGKRFEPAWGRILFTYADALRTTRDPKQARTKAFEGVDVAALEAAIRAWSAAN